LIKIETVTAIFFVRTTLSISDVYNGDGTLPAIRKRLKLKDAAYSTIPAEAPEIPPNKTQAFTW
jgi:hypothetical protein